jgi:hypothetical protein
MEAPPKLENDRRVVAIITKNRETSIQKEQTRPDVQTYRKIRNEISSKSKKLED